MPKNQPTSKNQKGRIPAWLGIIIIVVMAVIAATVIATNNKKKTGLETGAQVATPHLEPIYSYVGIIQELEDNQLRLSVPGDRNGLNADLLVTVIVDDITAFTSLEIPSQIPGDLTAEERQALFRRREITFSELDVGDDITVVAEENLRGKATFTAARIQKRIVK